ncbi:uncharacterized protein LOC132792477 [Drosophila nasuta]|uniref:uncharacterized protein LOC132792477 n=1 Tax=Drosophila nasuta TaxID=42062 RepID=UPI00295EBA28|nr:uncharacterized protein LOC132792477 [Drosophila nasuta]
MALADCMKNCTKNRKGRRERGGGGGEASQVRVRGPERTVETQPKCFVPQVTVAVSDFCDMATNLIMSPSTLLIRCVFAIVAIDIVVVPRHAPIQIWLYFLMHELGVDSNIDIDSISTSVVFREIDIEIGYNVLAM